MGKNPAFQWYPADWLRDPELRMASLVSRGIWMDLLCHMWAARTRGELIGTVAQLAQLVGTGIEEIEHFISEAETLKFADVTIRNGEVTVRNRRMMREERDRQNNAKRQANFRARAERTHEDNAEHNAPSNGRVTPPSSSSSSSSKRESTLTPKARKRKPETTWPEGFTLTDDLRVYAQKRGFDPETEFERFQQHAIAGDVLHRDWHGAFRTWILRAVEYRKEREHRNGNGKPAAPLPPTAAEFYGKEP